MSRWTIAGLLAVTTLVACSSELSRSQATEILGAHFDTLTAELLSDTVSRRVEIDRVIRPNESQRRVEFYLIYTYTTNDRADTSEVFSAVFQRSDEGWSLTRYGSSLRQQIAAVVANKKRHAYRGYLSALDTIYRSAQAWYTDQLGAPQGMNDAWLTLVEKGPSYDQVSELIALHNIPVPDSIEWGVYDPEFDSYSRILWVRSKADTTIQCFDELSTGSRIPARYLGTGLQDAALAVCTGGPARSFQGSSQTRDRIEQQLIESGSIYRSR